MLLYPSQDELLKQINSKYSLVMLAAKRAKQLHKADDPESIQMLDSYHSIRNVGKALEEIQAGDLIIDPASLSHDE